MAQRPRYYQEKLFSMIEQGLPYKVGWQVTRRCNLKCKQCYADAQTIESPDELSTTEALNLIDALADMGARSMVFTGGEPFLREDIVTLLSHAITRGLDSKIATNATLVTQSLARRLKEVGASIIHVSLDGSTAPVHDRIRGVAGAFDATLRGIRALKQEGLRVVIGVTIMRSNLDDIIPIMELSTDLGADVFTFNDMEPCGRGQQELGLEDITAEEREFIYQRMYAKWQDLKPRIYVDKFDPCLWLRVQVQHCQDPETREAMSAFAEKLGGCPAGRWVCLITPTGDVRPCAFLPIVVGNIREPGGFPRIWREAELFQQLRDDSNIHGPCKTCDFFRICRGCRSRAYHYTGDHLASDPGCILTGKEFYAQYEPQNRR